MTTNTKSRALSRKKKLFFSATLVLLICVLIEAASSVALLYYYRVTRRTELHEPSILSSVTLLYKLAGPGEEYQYDKQTSPEPFIIPDSVLGYSSPPGTYLHSYRRRSFPNGDWETLQTKVTINTDGSRWTGDLANQRRPVIYVFGDSFVFGNGVNDEQTFSYHMQQAMPNKKVKLFALGGYSLTQAYLRFNSLKTSINPQDVIVLGYADFYDDRHVADPQWLRSRLKWIKKYDPDKAHERRTLPRALLNNNGTIAVDYVEANCMYNEGLCNDPSLSSLEKSETSAALINTIARSTLARVYCLHIAGRKENPVRDLIDERVELISALPEDFEYFCRDDVEGFDPHPGPYWHYSISRKLIDHLDE